LEKPNTNYINQLSGDDTSFRKKFVNLLKSELVIEIDKYKKALLEREYSNASQYVHRLKHKVSVLGLEKGYTLASNYENELKEKKDSFSNQKKFDDMLTEMVEFLKCL